MVVLEITGKNVERFFANEDGGHRWQRVPDTEKHGRRHTSTITVAVLPVRETDVAAINENDIEWQATRGSGAGGQARNKTSNAVQMRHIPSGMTVRVESERSQDRNRKTAIALLAARLADAAESAASRTVAAERRAQVGTGQRGDKRRTIRTQNDSVVDHRTGKKMTVARYRAGHLVDLQ